MRVSLKIGDVLMIPLPDGRKAYGQYIYRGELGYLVRIFDLVTTEEVPVNRLQGARSMFPPVFIGLNPAIRIGGWRVTGNLPVKEFVHPKFRSTNGTKPGVYHDWSIWNGENRVFLGDLPPRYRSLERECAWGFGLIEERILTGVDPNSCLL